MADVQSAPASVPEYKSIEKVQGIPIVHDSLGYAHSVLSSNPYTSYVYSTGLGLSNTVFDYSKPIQARLAPILVRADGLALKGITVVESRFPYPFQTSTEDMMGAVKSSSNQAYSAFDSRVRTPAYGFAHSADKSLSPIVDKLELAVNKITPPPSTTDAAASAVTPESDQSQIGRAYRLSVQARDGLVQLSSEQVKQLQAHNVLVQRAMDTIYKLNGSVQAFGKDTQARVHTASSGIASELEKVQASASALPNKVQTSTKPLQTQLSQTLTDLRSALGTQGAPSVKAKQLASAVQNQIGPVLEALKETYSNFTHAASETAETATEGVPIVNGSGNGNGASVHH